MKVNFHEDDFDLVHDKSDGRIVVIGKREPHYWTTLHNIAEWMEANGNADIFGAISVNDLDHYDMTTKPEKGDAITAIRKHRDVIAVIALHLYGLDYEPNGIREGYHYTRENHKLLGLCMKRGIPLICWGDQPVPMDGIVPKGITRTIVGSSTMMYRVSTNGDLGTLKPIFMYEAGAFNYGVKQKRRK